jgi:steroid delta-isomerase-like uncharacterized protein
MLRDLIQDYFDAFNRQDIEGMLSTLSEDVQHDINEGGTEIGIEAFRAFKNHMARCYREEITDLVIMVEGTRGAAEFTCSGTYLQTDEGLPPATGQTYAIPAAVFFELKGNKIGRVTSYYNLRGWLNAVS